MTKLEATLQQFNEAADNFEEILKLQKQSTSLEYEVLRDSAIKRFELVFDTSWKTIKAWLEEKGSGCTSPLDCYREAHRKGIIEYQDIWIKIVKLRNQTAHIYHEKLAEKVYQELPDFLTSFKDLKEYLNKNKP